MSYATTTGEAGTVRLESPVTRGTRVVLMVAGAVLVAFPWVGEVSGSASAALSPAGILWLLVPTGIGLFTLTAAFASRGAVTTVSAGAMVVERHSSPMLPTRVDRYPAASIDGVEVIELYDSDSDTAHAYTWRVDVYVAGRRRALTVLPARTNRTDAEEAAARLRRALGLGMPLPPIELQARPTRRARLALAAIALPAWALAAMIVEHWSGQPLATAWPAAFGTVLLITFGLLTPLVALGTRGTQVRVRPAGRRVTIDRGFTSRGRRHEVLRFTEIEGAELVGGPSGQGGPSGIDLVLRPGRRRIAVHRSTDSARTRTLYRDLVAALSRP